jgi:ribose transport system substrate-binding protein
MPGVNAFTRLACLALLAVATGPALAQEVSVAVLTKNLTNPFFQSVRFGADKAGKAANVKVLHYVPTKADSIPEQLSQIDDITVKKPSAVLFTPVDSKAMAAGLEEINKAGIPVILLSERIADGKYLGFVGAADYDIALETARYLLKSIGGKGNIVIIEGVRGSQTSNDRVRGFNDALKEFKDAKLVASQPANYQRLQALQVMENLVQSHSQIDGVLAANDGMAVGAIEALDGANRKAAIIGINGSKEAVDAIIQGKMLASGDYNGFLQGCIGMMMAMRQLAKEPTPRDVLLKPIVVNKDNAKEYAVPLEQRTCPSWQTVESDLKTK